MSAGTNLGAVVSLTVAAALAFAAAPSNASGPPGTLLTTVLDGARAQQSVHYTLSMTTATVKVSMSADVASDHGIQRITFRKNGKVGKVTVIVVGDSAYIRGDAFTLANYMGFQPAIATGYANTWIAIPRGNRSYATVAEAVTLPSAIDELRLSSLVGAVVHTSLAGHKVVGIRGTSTGPGMPKAASLLYAEASGSRLPVQEVVVFNGGQIRSTFTRWNEMVGVQQPANAVSITKFQKSPTT